MCFVFSLCQGMDTDKYIADLNDENLDFLKVHSMFASKVLSLRPGEKAIVTNGAVSTLDALFKGTLTKVNLYFSLQFYLTY